jgi:hypothetical protein
MKRILLLFLLIICAWGVKAQNYNVGNATLARFVERMYNNAPFQGVKLLEDYDNKYLLCVVVLDPAKYDDDENVINRVAGVMAMSEASRFFNGSQITSDLVITTRENGNVKLKPKMLEVITEKSIGYVKSLSQLTNFTKKSGNRVFVYYKKID